MAEAGGALSEVRLQLTTRDNKLVLPETVGTILVPSCKSSSLLEIQLNNNHSCAPIWSINGCQ
jgi:hypothetical protein